MPFTARLVSRRATAIAGGVLLLALIAGFLVFAEREISSARAHVVSDLDNLAGIKALQISEWYRERLDDASGRGQDPLFVGTVREWVSGRRTPELAQRIQGSLTPKRVPWRYLNIWLLSMDGGTLFRASANPPADPSPEPGLIDACRRQRAPIIGVLHRDAPTPFLDMCISVVEADRPQADPIGIYFSRIDATQLLIPTVEFSTTPVRSAITTVVARDDGRIRTIVASANAASSAPSEEALAAALGTQGEASFSSTDARGQRLISAVHPVTNMPWSVIVSIPQTDADSPAIDELRETGVYALALLLVALLAVYEWVRQANLRNAADIVRFDRLLQVRSAINEAIVRIHQRDLMLSRFCEIAVSLGRFEFAAVFELSRPGVGHLAAWHGDMPQRLRDLKEFPIDDALRRGPLGPLFQPGQVVIVSDLAKLAPDPWSTSVLGDGHRAFVGVPIRERGAVNGFFALYSKQAGVFDQRDSQLFAELASDISYALENVEADQHRRLVDAQLQAVSDAAPFAMFLIDRQQQTIRMVNRAAVGLYGYTEDELVGRPAADIFSADDLVPQVTGEAGAVALPTSATHRHKDRHAIQVEVATRAIAIDGQQALVTVALDVTERRELEHQFRQAQRLEAVGRLAGGVAHDFNNLLTVMGGFASLMLRELPADSPSRESAETIKTASERAAALTSQLLAFSRRQSMEIQRVHLNTVVRETASMLSRLIGEDVQLEIVPRSTRDAVNIDPTQMQQVIMNLAVNARDALPLGGWIRISTADYDDGSPDGAVELKVVDTGLGIPPEVLDHIFEPFFTTKPTGQGTGLGLSTVHGIVTQSGGTIGVDSVVGEGTTFWMRFPRAEDEPLSSLEIKTVAAAPGHGTILLVEDDRGVRAFTTRVLTTGGYEVIGCANGFEAINQHTLARRGSINLLLTDVVMPGTSGPEVAERLHAVDPDLSVLFMSGYADEAVSRLGLNIRAMDVIKKPFDPDELLRRVESAMRRASA